MTDYTPAGGGPHALTYTAGAPATAPPPGQPDITGGQLVMLEAGSSGTVVPTEAAGPYVGVAAADAMAGMPVTVLCGGGVWHEGPTAAAVPAGNFVSAGADGLVVSAGVAFTLTTIGVCVRASDPAAAVPVPCRWLAYR